MGLITPSCMDHTLGTFNLYHLGCPYHFLDSFSRIELGDRIYWFFNCDAGAGGLGFSFQELRDHLCN